MVHLVQNTHRLIASRWPTVGVFDLVASPEDIAAALELEMLTNDRLAPTPERLHALPMDRWVVGVPNASIIMAAYLHADEKGSRFTTGELGGWYCSFDLVTSIRETVWHHTARLAHSEAGFHQTIQMRQLHAHADAEFDDVRGMRTTRPELYRPDNYEASQAFGAERRNAASNGICYDSVRHEGGTNLVIYRPALVLDVMQGDHFQYEWTGERDPRVSKLTNMAAF
ncbi:MAG TPA: RES family NAD+ phosphorylase [Xanthobacteraceae bacterium]|jgi:hypothetical protein